MKSPIRGLLLLLALLTIFFGLPFTIQKSPVSGFLELNLVGPDIRHLAEISRLMVTGAMQRVLRTPELWLLTLVACLLNMPLRTLASGVLAFAGGWATARWMNGLGVLTISGHLAPLVVLSVVLLPALDLARGSDRTRSWLQPLWILATLLGALFGAVPEHVTFIGRVTNDGSVILPMAAGVGAGVGVFLIGITSLQLRRALLLFPTTRAIPLLGDALAVLVIGLAIPRVAALVLFPGSAPSLAVELSLIGILGFALPVFGMRVGGAGVGIFALLLAVGSGLSFGADAILLGRALVLGTILIIGTLLASSRPLTSREIVSFSVLATLICGWHLGQVIAQNSTLTVPAAIGLSLLAITLFHGSLGISEALGAKDRARVARILGTVTIVSILVRRGFEYFRWLTGEVAEQFARGIIVVPALAFVLATLALLLRPRRRRVAEALGIDQPSNALSAMLLGAAFILLPFGTISTRSSGWEVSEPQDQDVRQIVAELLSNTYHAFNLNDETALYDRISESVTGSLIGDIYLDSRRRLTAGTAAEDEVRVQRVEVLGVESDNQTRDIGAGAVYLGQWIVTASVRHLQHTHHRQNFYTGLLTLRMEDDRWKISGLELLAEDREVIR